jgi:hypothetical protein
MDGAWSNNDKQSPIGILALYDGDRLVAPVEYCLSRLGRLWDLALEEVGGREGVVSADAPIL